LPTFNIPQANLGAGLAHLQQANPSPEANVAMAYVRVATTLFGGKERGIQVNGIYVESALAQSIQSACA
jgi:hypothetical protein